MSTVYRLADIVYEPDIDDPCALWVAPVPQGPVARLDGVGPLIIELLLESPKSTDELLQEMRATIPDMPSDADETVRAFLDSLVGSGILTREEPV